AGGRDCLPLLALQRTRRRPQPGAAAAAALPAGERGADARAGRGAGDLRQRPRVAPGEDRGVRGRGLRPRVRAPSRERPAGPHASLRAGAPARGGSMTVVVVTGASAGVGRATARAFARDGADVGLIARGRERLESTRREVEELGRRASVVEADVADAGQVEAA